jgi:hypothetical protein
LAAQFANSDPSAAAEWVGQIGDDTLRNRAEANVFLTWRKQDAPTAQAWLDSLSDAPEALRRYLIQRRQ